MAARAACSVLAAAPTFTFHCGRAHPARHEWQATSRTCNGFRARLGRRLPPRAGYPPGHGYSNVPGRHPGRSSLHRFAREETTRESHDHLAPTWAGLIRTMCTLQCTDGCLRASFHSQRPVLGAVSTMRPSQLPSGRSLIMWRCATWIANGSRVWTTSNERARPLAHGCPTLLGRWWS